MAEAPLTVVGDEMEAEVLCGMLRTNGIECYHRREGISAGISALAGGVTMAGPTAVIVNESDLEAARSLLPAP